MSDPRILYVTSHWPGAAAYGTQQRLLHIGRLLQRIGRVTLVVVDCFGEAARWRRLTECEFEIGRVIDVKDPGSHGVIGRLRHELDPRYLQTVPVTVERGDRRAMLDLFRQHDLIWVHSITTANVLGIHRWPRSVIDIDDVPSRVYRSSAGLPGNLMRRLLDLRMSAIWRRREAKLAERFGMVLVCSNDDRRYLGLPRMRVLPNGFERLPDVEARPAHPPRIGFIGTFKHWANVDGVRWFCDEVWPLVRRQLPDGRLRLVGERSALASGWGEGVEALGRVDDAGPEIATWSAMIVPVRTGGGTRIKIAEAFARRCPAVATTLGAFGYDVRDGDELFVCDRPDLFATRCVELVQSPERAREMADRAHRRFLQSWTWESYGTIVDEVVKEVAHSGGVCYDTELSKSPR